MPFSPILDDLPTQQLVDELGRRLLTAETAATFLDTHISYIWELVRIGRLKTIKVFGRSLFEREMLEAELQRREQRKQRIALNKESLTSPEPQRPAYNDWRVVDLQYELKCRGLRVRGRKTDLVARLVSDDETERS